ncbi:MAG: hypothetical protein ACTSV2_18765 [Candidatus Thorarchaeota archaeon]
MTDSGSQTSGKLEDYIYSRKLEDNIYTLMKRAYADIIDRTVKIVWGSTETNAVIIRSQNKSDTIRCNRAIRDWPESAIIGLLSHELSHISLRSELHTELQTDKDVIARGVGHYLAIERAFTNKISDHVLREGEDRYLGYASIRKLLKFQEVQQLDRLMSELEMVADADRK